MLSLAILIRQIIVIVAVARLVGSLFRRLLQPQVVGEMAAGVMLGPSLLGWLLPGVAATLFPPDSLGYLNAISQLGLLLFMFIIGLDLDVQGVRRQGRAAVVTSLASIVVPFLLGSALAFYLYPRLSDPTVPRVGFMLFLGAAMSVTAFPVLARILNERGLTRTSLGTLSIACAALADVTAWCMLAAIILFVRSDANSRPLWITVGGSLLYVILVLTVIRRLLQRLEANFHKHAGLSNDLLAVVGFLVLASAWTTEWLGIHALFGAFILGVAMPKDAAFVRSLTDKFESLTVVLLLPLFFAFTGLRMSVTVMNSWEMWGYCALITCVAVLGKLGGSTIAARLMGVSSTQALAIGILMNTRGLMELVILNIGLDLKLISPQLFSMMVMMALFTTAMTTPLMEWVYPRRLAVVERLEGVSIAKVPVDGCA